MYQEVCLRAFFGGKYSRITSSIYMFVSRYFPLFEEIDLILMIMCLHFRDFS